MLDRNELKRIYWEEGGTLEIVGSRFHYTKQGMELLFRKMNIPTSVSLIRNFGYFMGDPELDYYLRWYMNNFNRYGFCSKGYPRWEVNSKSKENLDRLGRHLIGEVGITYFISDKLHSYRLVMSGFKNCISLSFYYDVDWYDELIELIKEFPESPKLRQGEAISRLLSVMRSGKWFHLPELSMKLKWSSDRTKHAIYRAMDKGLIERRGKGRKYEYKGKKTRSKRGF